MKSSKRGIRTLSLVTEQNSVSSDNLGQLTEIGLETSQKTSLADATSMTAVSQQRGLNYGWKPAYARMQNSFDPYETWLLTQAKSYLGRDVTIEETKELFNRIDPSTRKPREMPTAPRPVGLLAALRALVAGGVILLASGCSNTIQAEQISDASGSYETIAKFPVGPIRKTYDRAEGIVCYTYRESINCMVAKPGDGQ